MPWQEVCPMDEKMRFIGAVLAEEESMVELCERFGISRKTGYKWRARYLTSRGRGGNGGALARTTGGTVGDQLRRRLRRSSGCGARIRAGARRSCARAWSSAHQWTPAPSTIGELLRREGLSQGRKRRGAQRAQSDGLRTAVAPNDLWCIDFKGWFRTADGVRCDPLTVTDAFSRYLLCPRSLLVPTTAAAAANSSGCSGSTACRRDPLGQRHAVRLAGRRGPEPAVSPVGQARDYPRAHRARPAAAERAA